MMTKFPRMIWITGLSGAGKSTLADEMVSRLQVLGKPVVHLDGDELRAIFGTTHEIKDHTRERRLDLAQRYAKLCHLLVSQGFTVVIATISLFREVHQWNRQNIPGLVMVYLRVPLEELKRRDPKRIYQRFADGTLKNIAGLDFPVDEPEDADFTFDYDPELSASHIADHIMKSYLPEIK